MVSDLHMHSTASDGELTPEQVVKRARDRGIEWMALSDHDTAAGVEQAQAAGRQLGVNVVSAIELSAAFAGELHILGYGLNIHHAEFEVFTRQQQLRRAQRNLRMVEALQLAGLPITEEDCRRLAPGAGENWGRSHMARALVEKGLCTHTKEAFDRYLGYGKSCYVPREKTSPAECIGLIHRCGGLAVLAHPGLIQVPEPQLFALIHSLWEQGLDGLEAYYPQHSPRQAAQYVRTARMLGLYVTYGSDFHGPSRMGNEMLAGWLTHCPEGDVAAFLDQLMEEKEKGNAHSFK